MLQTHGRQIASAIVLSLLAGSNVSVLAQAPSADQPVQQPAIQPEAPAIAPAATGAPSVPENPAAPAVKNKIVIAAVQGKVTYRLSEDAKFQKAKVGDVLTEGTTILTGLGDSAVQILVGDNQLFTVDRCTQTTVRTAITDGATATTTLDIPVGRLKFDVDKSKLANKVSIQAPDATLAVKGTTGGIEVVPGQPTAGFGGEFNTGRITMTYKGRISSEITGNGKSTSEQYATALVASTNLFVDPGDKSSRQHDEQDFVEDHITAPTVLAGTVGNVQLTAPGTGTGYYETDLFGSIMSSTDIKGMPISQVSGLSGFETRPVAGTFYRDPRSGAPVIVALENLTDSDGAPMPVLRTYALGTGSVMWRFLTSFPQQGVFGRTSWQFSGVSPLGSTLYAAGTSYTEFGTEDQVASTGRIFSLPSAQGHSPIPLMSLGLDLQPGMANNNGRGTLFVVGSVPGSSFGFGQGHSFIILEIDPRVNMIRNAAGNVTGQISAGTSELASITAVTGLAYLNNTLVMTGTNAQNQALRILWGAGTANTNSFAPTASLSSTVTGSGSQFQRIAMGPVASGRTPSSPTLLPGTNPQLDFVDPLFASMAYSTAARQSGVIEALVRQQILSTASNPGACAANGDLNSLAQILSLNDNRRAGIGMSIAEFRRRLQNSEHYDCLPPALRNSIIRSGSLPNCGCHHGATD